MISSTSNSFSPQYLDSSALEPELELQEAKDTLKTIAVRAEQVEIADLKLQITKLQREQTRIQELLSSLGFALRSFNNVNQFLELTPLMAARVADAEGGALLLFHPDGQVRLAKIYCSDSQYVQVIRRTFEQAPLLNNFVNHLEHRPTSLAEIDVNAIEDFIQQELAGIAVVHGTPILVKNDERGRLYVFSQDLDYAWDITRRKLVQLVADQTAVAIANHDLTQKLRSKEKQDRELEIASEIQSHLQPSECPQIKGLAIAAECRNAYRVGGDYYDFIPTNYDRIRRQDDPKVVQCVPWSIVIGDVMGKGVPAGLIMTMTRGMLRAEILNRHSPAKILTHLNRVMYPDLDNSHRFVTLFYSEYDPVTRKLSFSNAAHHPPLLWRIQTQTIEKLDTEGMLIGLDMDSEYQESQVILEVGDIVLFYTDGLTDAVNAHGDRFDEENLHSIFQEACQTCDHPDQILRALFTKVDQFTYPKTHRGDDMTLVVVQVQSDAVYPNNCR